MEKNFYVVTDMLNQVIAKLQGKKFALADLESEVVSAFGNEKISFCKRADSKFIYIARLLDRPGSELHLIVLPDQDGQSGTIRRMWLQAGKAAGLKEEGKMYEYNNGLKPGGRCPRLYLAKEGKVEKFAGEDIPEYCFIVKEQYEASGKWSNTTYQLELLPGVRPLYFLSPLHGVWGEYFSSWGEVVEKLSLPIDIAKKVVFAEYPKTANRLDKIEQEYLQLEQKQQDAEVITISFGAPTNRQAAAGFWEDPKSGVTSTGAEVSVAPGEKGWDTPIVTSGPSGTKVISSTWSPGMHGGYQYVEVFVPIG